MATRQRKVERHRLNHRVGALLANFAGRASQRSLARPGYPRLSGLTDRGSAFILLTLIFTLTALASPGCRRNDPGFELISLDGTIEEIKRNRDGTGEIIVLYFSEKHGQEMLGIGLVTSETEIMINGAVAKLGDLREGDRIRGDVRVDTKQGKKRQVALKIYVDRAQPVGGN